jgi:glucose-6-phosphate isomerase
MPKDNHSVMQLYLDGFNNNFFTFFYVKEKNTPKINNHKYIIIRKVILKEKVWISQFYMLKKKQQKMFLKKKNIPFRSFEIKKRDEKTLGELFCFFILETILLGKALKLDPYDQPAVELIKIETKKLLT